MLKNWLTSGSIAFGVSFICVLPFNRNLAQSALIGLATTPGVITSMVVRSRQRYQRIDRQIGLEMSRLSGLRQQKQTLDRQLQLTVKERQSIEARVNQLNTLVINLTDRIDRDNQYQIQLEQHLSTIATHCQQREDIATRLNTKISDKQATLLEVTAQLSELRQQFNHTILNLTRQQERSKYLAAQLVVKTHEIAASDRRLQLARTELTASQLELANLESQLNHKIDEVNDRELVNLKSQLNSVESAYTEKQAQLAYLDSQLLSKTNEIESSDRSLQLTQLEISTRQAELVNLESQFQTKVEETNQIDLVGLRKQLHSIETEFKEKQTRLEDLNSQLTTKINEIEASDRSLELTQLELVDRRSELAELEAKIHTKLEEMDEVELDLKIAMQRIEPQPPQTSRNIDDLLKPEEWHHNFIDNPHLAILQHIDKHGSIAEAEVNHKLGNPRSVRQFANKLEEYTQHLPFTIRVESSPQGNRYLRDS